MPLIFSLYDISCRSTDGDPEYSVRFTVRSDENDRLEIQPKRILNQFTIPTVYTGFDVDDEDLEAGLTEIDIGEDRTDDDGVCYRMLTLRYGVSDEGTPRPPHETEQDPLEWEPQVFIRDVERSISPDRLLFFGAYELNHDDDCEECQFEVPGVDIPGPTFNSVNNGACKMDAVSYSAETGLVFKCYPMQSTAGEQFANRPQIKKNDKEITIIVNVAEVQGPDFDITSCYEETINSASFTISLPLQGFARTFSRWTVRLNGIHLELRSRKWRDESGVEQTRVYWEKRYVLQERRTGWFLDVLNQGRQRSAGIGDLAADGVTVLAAPDLKDNDPLQAVLEREGFTGAQHLLTLQGQPRPDKDSPVVYLRYIERLTDFRRVELGLPVTDPIGD